MHEDAARFFDRQRALYADGYRGRDLYKKLATDPALPPYLKEDAAADVAGLSPAAMAMRRMRKQQPDFIRHSNRSVVYPVHALVEWLGAMLIEAPQ